MELKLASKLISDIYHICLELKPENIEFEAIDNWRKVIMDLHLIRAKNSEEYNFMQTIISSYHIFLESLPIIQKPLENLNNEEKRIFIDQFIEQYEVIISRLKQLEFNISFYEQFGYFNNNVVAVGANGSGKTSLADNLRSSLNNNGLVISAQRVLFIPEIDNIPSPEKSDKRWTDMNKKSRTFKDIDDFLEIKEEFGFVLGNLVAKHCNYAVNRLNDASESRVLSELEITLQIWNEIFDHRSLRLVDGIKLKVYDQEESYDPLKLSEGEKSALYLISQVIQAPKNGFIIIDEPEMYLHKTIISKIWNILEIYRQDCTFIYLTHDLDFAVTRNTAAKVWLKSFVYPNLWDIKRIPENLIPEKLMLELLGSRIPILFCEGTKNSIDQNIYQTLLPNFTIMPVESCLNVINFTKAYNTIPNVNTKAYGIIDADHHCFTRLEKLKLDNIFSLKLAEVENLFLHEKLLLQLAPIFFKESKVLHIMDEVLKELEKEKILQASRFVSCKINNFFNESHVSKANSLESIEVNFIDFNTKIEIKRWFEERLTYIEDIIKRNDYNAAISIYNNKGLKRIVERNFSKPEYTDFVLKYLSKNNDIKQIVRDLLPQELVNA
ncbi:AAA family ATPase [Pedobacter cryotolerans]|uniref:ATP-binding protein n=1 Tax=Pedobacter cryotolerans TaxID=2571270 RepID=A0A4U1CF16_9SPHI|nr:AAA family ATPase [Pedobacter cryotolerans]TKC03470.1 ATP-binding protein [Pedobacter cryotolerans]